jgi:hypothetical protein
MLPIFTYMSKQDKEKELSTRKNQNSLSEAKDDPETDTYENPIEKPTQSVDDDNANEDPA